MKRFRHENSLAEQERQAAAVKAATEKDEAHGMKPSAPSALLREVRKKVELAAGRAAVAALAEFEAVAKAISQGRRRDQGGARPEDTYSRVSHDADAEGVLLRHAHARADCASGLSSVVAGMAESEMLKVI